MTCRTTGCLSLSGEWVSMYAMTGRRLGHGIYDEVATISFVRQILLLCNRVAVLFSFPVTMAGETVMNEWIEGAAIGFTSIMSSLSPSSQGAPRVESPGLSERKRILRKESAP